MSDYDYLIKFLALGDSGVGKTSFLVSTRRFIPLLTMCLASVYGQHVHGSVHINRRYRLQGEESGTN